MVSTIKDALRVTSLTEADKCLSWLTNLFINEHPNCSPAVAESAAIKTIVKTAGLILDDERRQRIIDLYQNLPALHEVPESMTEEQACSLFSILIETDKFDDRIEKLEEYEPEDYGNLPFNYSDDFERAMLKLGFTKRKRLEIIDAEEKDYPLGVNEDARVEIITHKSALELFELFKKGELTAFQKEAKSNHDRAGRYGWELRPGFSEKCTDTIVYWRLKV